MRLFLYVWNEEGKLFYTRISGRGNRTFGDSVYRHKDIICPHLYDDSLTNSYEHCKGEIAVIGLSEVRSTSYNQVAQNICGHLESLGWGVCMSPFIYPAAENEIRAISTNSRT